MGIRIRDHSVRPQPTVVVKTASKQAGLEENVRMQNSL